LNINGYTGPLSFYFFVASYRVQAPDLVFCCRVVDLENLEKDWQWKASVLAWARYGCHYTIRYDMNRKI